MKVLVTGAAGYMGKYVVKELLGKGHEVYAIDFNHKEIDSRAEILDVDIFSGDDRIYEKVKCPDLCIHLAWQDGFVHNSPKHMENLSKHFTFLKNLIDGGCKRIAVMGTMHEIGFWEGAVDENTPCNPWYCKKCIETVSFTANPEFRCEDLLVKSILHSGR